MGGMSLFHWIIILVIVMLVFGTKKLRNIGQDLGGAVKGFKDGMKSSEETKEQIAQSSSATDKTVDVQAKDVNK